MYELSLNVLDIAQNSVTAEATKVGIRIVSDIALDSLTIEISDNGRGMSAELLKKVTDPFTTTRTTRKVGLGIPLFKDAAESCGGSFMIESTLGVGTVTRARFALSHIDRAPLGDMGGTMTSLIVAAPHIAYSYYRKHNALDFTLSTDEVKAVMEGIPIDTPAVLAFISDFISENEKEITGGIHI